jgi:hypothetical protein
LACLCGVCSLACNQDTECDAERPARCLAPTDYAQCNGGSGLLSCRPTCDEQDDCGDGQTCLRNVCIAKAFELNDFCLETEAWPDADAFFELALIDRINAQRTAGTECGLVTIPPQEALVLDYRLRCAGRVHTAEMRSLGYYDETSPDGTTAGERMRLAGHPATSWSVFIAQSPSEAVLDQLLVDYCDWFSEPSYTGIGVGVTGDFLSINLASE